MALSNSRKLFVSAAMVTAALAVSVTIAGCRGLLEPKLPAGAERFSPPAVYSEWWQLTKGCSERTGELASIRWYRTPGQAILYRGEWVAGYWMSLGNRVVIAEGQMYHGSTVRHEMLHALLRQGGHPRTEFLGACASLVGCSGACMHDVGRWSPPGNYVVLPPDSLSVSTDVELLPREVDGQRWLKLWVIATNPRDEAVLVRPRSRSPTPATFYWYLIGPDGISSGGEVATDSSMLFFAARESKRFRFDFRVDTQPSEYSIKPEKYAIAGLYSQTFSTFDTLELIP